MDITNREYFTLELQSRRNNIFVLNNSRLEEILCQIYNQIMLCRTNGLV